MVGVKNSASLLRVYSIDLNAHNTMKVNCCVIEIPCMLIKTHNLLFALSRPVENYKERLNCIPQT